MSELWNKREGVRFCYIARGSLEEVHSHLALAHRIGYLSDELYASLMNEIQTLRRTMNGYIAFLKQSKHGANEPGAYHFKEDGSLYVISSNEPDNPSTDYLVTDD